MARIIHDDQGGSSSPDEGQLTVIHLDGQSQIDLPAGDFMAQGDILRDGQDLVLQSSDGSEVVIEGYFSAMPAPTLTTPHGSLLTPELVQSFVKSEGPAQYAANATENDESAVGLIKEVSGDATITRTDGSSEKAVLGMEVHQGDIVETTAEGAVNIVFLDESSFAISNNARLAIDEYVFDPTTQAGETNVSLLRGMFVFTSGLIGRDDPDDVRIDTPVGSIGIRGTTIAGHILPNGESQITVVEGAIVIKNGVNEITLAEQYETVTLSGFDQKIEVVGTLDSGQMKTSYGMLGTVNAGFFNTLNTEAEGQKEPVPVDAAPPADAPAGEALPPQTPTGEQGALEAPQPMMASYDIFSDPLVAGFDQNVLPKDPLRGLFDGPLLDRPLLGDKPFMMDALNENGDSGLPLMEDFLNRDPAMLPPLELIVKIFVDDNAIEGDIVGRAFTTLPYPNALMAFREIPVDINGDPLFRLVSAGPGVYNIILTTAGEDHANGASLGSILGNVGIEVTLGDGRTQSAAAPAHYGDYTAPVIQTIIGVDLNTLSGAQGYVYNGAAGSEIGYSAVYLGDLQRDGDNDFAVATNAGHIKINGYGNITVPGDATNLSVSGMGDVNGDGKLDFVVGRSLFDAGFSDNGQVNIHNGNVLTAKSTTNGLASADNFGHAVAMVDFNGDGYSDVFASATGANSLEGEVSRLLGNSSFTFTGVGFAAFSAGAAGGFTDSFGLSMTGLNDFNNDGFGDMAVGGMSSSTSGYVKIYYGNASGNVGTSLLLSGIDINNGKMPLFDMGDINGDGKSDLLVGATGANSNQGAAWIYYGGDGARDLAIEATGGSKLMGAGSAGDFNGDGYSDIFVSIRTGSSVDAYVIYGSAGLAGTITLDPSWIQSNPGKGFHMTLNLSGELTNPTTDEFNMLGTSVGDQNGDGFNDLLISSSQLNYGDGGYFVVYGRANPLALAGGNPEIHTDVGANANAPANMITSSHGDGLVGSAANNIMSNLNAGNTHLNVSFAGGGGNDIINFHGTAAFTARAIDGGENFDELRLFSTGTIDMRNISEISGIEEIAFQATGIQYLQIGLNDIFSLLQSSDNMTNHGWGTRQTLMITDDGASGTKGVQIDDAANRANMVALGFSNVGTASDGGSTYNVFTYGAGYQLLIETTVTTNVV